MLLVEDTIISFAPCIFRVSLPNVVTAVEPENSFAVATTAPDRPPNIIPLPSLDVSVNLPVTSTLAVTPVCSEAALMAFTSLPSESLALISVTVPIVTLLITILPVVETAATPAEPVN